MDRIILKDSLIEINGVKKIVLCASLFYFRIPKAEWADRISKLKSSGYNCVDVYFPWNYHEVLPGQWEMEGEKDVDAFLKMLSDFEMYVVARPGPYICSEWDGGSIPAWVLTDEKIKIRDYDKGFLTYVKAWYEKIMPVIAKYEIGRGGTVIFMQIDNELDFFDCQNPKAYMTSLREMATDLGITVPIIGCAGQGNIEQATGWADHVEPSFNFYGDPYDPTFEDKIFYYYSRLSQLGKPLIITETSCSHLLLRRELAAGAKLIGPYNQVCGTNFGFTGSINNWGKPENPVSYITTQYGWGGIIGSAGELNNEYPEAALFSGLISSYGESLAGAVSKVNTDYKITCNFRTNKNFHMLELLHGGRLLFIPNLGDSDGTACIESGDMRFNIDLKAHEAPFIPLDVPCSIFGFDGTIYYGNCELSCVEKHDGVITLIFTGGGATPFIKLRIDKNEYIASGKDTITEYKSRNGMVRIRFTDSYAYAYEKLAEANSWKEKKNIPSKLVKRDLFKTAKVSENLTNMLKYAPAPITTLEKAGVYSGFGSYRISVEGCKGILLHNISDIIVAYRNGKYFDGRVSAGCTQYYEGAGNWTFFIKIWGHSNFDDSRQPALQLRSPKGIQKATAIKHIQKIDPNWFFSYCSEPIKDTLKIPSKAVETMISINSWNTTRVPVEAVYTKQIELARGCNNFIFCLDRNSTDAYLYVDGKIAGRINPFDPYIDISEHLKGKDRVELALRVTKRNWAEQVGEPILYSGVDINICEFAAWQPKDVIRLSNIVCNSGTQFPIEFKPGDINIARLYINDEDVKSGYLSITGKDAIVAVICGDRIIGRTILDWERRPYMAGNPSHIYLPESYISQSREINLLVIGVGEKPEITNVHMLYID